MEKHQLLTTANSKSTVKHSMHGKKLKIIIYRCCHPYCLFLRFQSALKSSYQSDWQFDKKCTWLTSLFSTTFKRVEQKKDFTRIVFIKAKHVKEMEEMETVTEISHEL